MTVRRFASPIQRARWMLRRVATGGSAQDIFDALTGVVPFAAGLLDTFTEGATEAGIVVTARMSPDLVDVLMHTRDVDAPQIHPVIAAVPLGRLLVDREARRSLDFDGVGGYGELGRWGLGQPCAMPIVRSAGLGGPRQNTYVALIRERGEPGYSDAETMLVQSLWTDIADAVERARLPLTATEPILHQVIREERMGLALVNAAGRVIESNFLAHSLAARYLHRINVSTQRSALSGFVSAILEMPLTHGAPLVVSGASGAALHVSVHLLLADTHAARENVRLMLIRELPPRTSTSESAELQGLPPRLREVAGYLTQTGLGQKQIADRMGISPGTLRKHIERLYREMGVGSRAELAHRTQSLKG